MSFDFLVDYANRHNTMDRYDVNNRNTQNGSQQRRVETAANRSNGHNERVRQPTSQNSSSGVFSNFLDFFIFLGFSIF